MHLFVVDLTDVVHQHVAQSQPSYGQGDEEGKIAYQKCAWREMYTRQVAYQCAQANEGGRVAKIGMHRADADDERYGDVRHRMLVVEERAWQGEADNTEVERDLCNGEHHTNGIDQLDATEEKKQVDNHDQNECDDVGYRVAHRAVVQQSREGHKGADKDSCAHEKHQCQALLVHFVAPISFLYFAEGV